MARVTPALLALNRGRISRLGLARVDLESRVPLSAETQVNWMPRTLGSMMVRPGLQHITGTDANGTVRVIDFVFSATDTALYEISGNRPTMRVYIEDIQVKRSFVSTTSTNGNFSINLNGWTDADDLGASSTHVSSTDIAGPSTGFMELVGTPFASARRRIELAVAATDQNVEHGVRVEVSRGEPKIKIGSALGDSDYQPETVMRPGTYSFGVVSTGNLFIELSANTEYGSLINKVVIESTQDGLTSDNVLTLPLVSSSTLADLNSFRWDQSNDVVFLAAGSTTRQMRIERLGNGSSTGSWAVSEYAPQDGPFSQINTDDSKRVNATATKGDVTLEAAEPLFEQTDVGRLFRTTSEGQKVTVSAAGTDQFSAPIRVSGIEETRIFSIIVDSTFVATVSVQRSIGTTDAFVTVTGLTFTATSTSQHDDGLDNEVAYYRIGIGSTYTSGTAECTLDYASGGLVGVARITSVTSSTSTPSTAASAIVLQDFGSTKATSLWEAGLWSDKNKYPTAVTFHEGRLWWAGQGKILGSVSDSFEGFDPDVEGDSGPINRILAGAGVDRVQWMHSLGRLVVGTESDDLQVKTSSLEEPLTPSNFNVRDIENGGQGSANVGGVKIGKSAMFVQAGQQRIMRIHPNAQLDLSVTDQTLLVPEIGEPAITKMVVQRQPDTRVHCLRSNGTVAVLVSDPAENVSAWIDVASGDATSTAVNLWNKTLAEDRSAATTSIGFVEDMAVLPSSAEDAVYYMVQRVIGGSTKRRLERWALESQARKSTDMRVLDAHIVKETTATTVVLGLDHLNGETVSAWGNGKDLGSYTVSSNQITISEESTFTVVGLPYTPQYVSSKLAYGSQGGTALTQRKRVNHLGFVLADTHSRGLLFGPSTDHLDDLPAIESFGELSTDTIYESYDEDSIEFPGSWETDPRVVLQGVPNRPATVMAVVVQLETKDKK